MTTMPATDAVGRCAFAVSAYFGALFGSLEAIGARVAGAFDDDRAVSAAALTDVVEPLAAAALAEHPVVGAGFVAHQGWLADRDLYLAWWQGESDQPLAERGVPIGHHVFDYTRHEWFETPRVTGTRHVTGPYVDYVCSNVSNRVSAAAGVWSQRTRCCARVRRSRRRRTPECSLCRTYPSAFSETGAPSRLTDRLGKPRPIS